MASETLVVPEEHLRDVITVLRYGLRATNKVAPEVRRQLSKWCKEEEEYLSRLENG